MENLFLKNNFERMHAYTCTTCEMAILYHESIQYNETPILRLLGYSSSVYTLPVILNPILWFIGEWHLYGLAHCQRRTRYV